jgi:Transcriptional repressor TCF25
MSTRALQRLREERRVQQQRNDDGNGNGNGGVGGGTTCTTDGDPADGEDNGLLRRRLPADVPDDDDGNEEEEADEEDDDDGDDDGDDAVYGGKARVSAFLWHGAHDDDDDDDSDSGSEDDDDSDAGGGGDVVKVAAATSSPPSAPSDARGKEMPSAAAAAGEEMQQQQQQQRQKGATTTPKEPNNSHGQQQPQPLPLHVAAAPVRAGDTKAAALPRAAGKKKQQEEEEEAAEKPAGTGRDDEDGKAQEKEDGGGDDDDDWDAILREFRTKDRERAGGAKDEQGGGAGGGVGAASGLGPASSQSASEFLLAGMDWTDLDVERARAAAIFAPRIGAGGGDARGGGGGIRATANTAATPAAAARRRTRRTAAGSGASASSANVLFGGPEAGWDRHNPPTYVGGGIGIVPYSGPHHAGEEDEARAGTAAGEAAAGKGELPWPYCDTTLILGQGRGAGDKNRALPRVDCADAKRWYAFVASDVSRRDADDYRDVIERSGDVTSLLLFVLHHPYCVPALLQASAVLYQTNRSQHAMSMLKRALWVLDCAMQWSVARQWQAGSAVFMDASVNDLNACYFRALRALMRASSHAGYAQNCSKRWTEDLSTVADTVRLFFRCLAPPNPTDCPGRPWRCAG